MSRTLMLLRHAKSAWPDVPDHERPLARRGQRDAPAVGRWLRAARPVPDQVLCSTARRARETWQLAQAELGATPPVISSDRVYQASAADLIDLTRRTSPSVRALLIVGHNPAIQELALTLAARTDRESGIVPADALARMRAKFPTAAIAILEFTGGWGQLAGGGARLTRFVTPHELKTP